jgi:hypothetical protein
MDAGLWSVLLLGSFLIWALASSMKFGFTPEAEILNARLAMLGFVAGVGAYLTTGQIIPGIL